MHFLKILLFFEYDFLQELLRILIFEKHCPTVVSQCGRQAALALAHGVLDTGMQRGDGSSTRRRPGISTQVRGIHASSLPRRSA